MNKTTNFIAITLGCSLLGIGYYAWQQRWIIFNIPVQFKQNQTSNYTKKKAAIYLWRHESWTHETVELLWANHEPFDAQQLIQATLTLLAEEHDLKKKITIEHVLEHTNHQQLLVFLDGTPFSKNMSIRTKLMIIESILKTLRENGIKTPSINFFVNNQPLPDAHLDFSNPWPLLGFVNGAQ